MRPAGLAILATLLLCATPMGVDAEPTTPEQEAIYRWFDTLGFPDVANRTFVRLPGSGRESMGLGVRGDDRPHEHGFVVEDTDEHLVVLTVGLEERTYERSRPPMPVEVPLAPFLERGLDLLDGPTGGSVDPFGIHHWVTPQRFRLIVLARWAARRGHAALATRLFDKAAAIRLDRTEDAGTPFAERIAREFALERLEATRTLLVDPSRTWADIHAAYATWMKHFAAYDDRGWTSKRLAEAARQAEEERRRAARATDGTPLTLAERIEDAVWALGQIDGLRSRPWAKTGTKSGLVRILEIGPEAVPRLVEALDDHRLARQANTPEFFHAQYRRRFQIVESRQVAAIALRRLAGIARPSNQSLLIDPLDAEATQALRTGARSWWEHVKSVGLRAWLVEQVREKRSPWAARTLVWRHPDLALDEIRKAVAGAEDDDEVAAVLSALVELKTPDADAYLHDMLAHDASVSRRVAAAHVFLERGDDSVLPVLIAQWRAYHDVGGHGVLPHALALWGGMRGVGALASRLEVQSYDVRVVVAEMLAKPWFAPLAQTSFEGTRWPPRWTPQERGFVEHVLVAALDSSKDRGALPPYWGPRSGGEGRIATLATEGLQRIARARRPKPAVVYDDEEIVEDDESDPSSEAEQRRLVNAWRSAHGMSLVPDPHVAPRPVPAALDMEVRAAIGAAGDALAAEAALTPLASLGARVVPVLCAWAEELGPAHPATPVLRARAMHLARTVVPVERPTGAAQAPAGTTAPIAELRDRELEAGALPKLVGRFLQGAAPGTGVLLTLRRDARGAGIEASYEVLTGTLAGSRGGELRAGLAVEEKQVVPFSAHALGDESAKAAAWRAFVKALDGALADPGIPAFEVRVFAWR